MLWVPGGSQNIYRSQHATGSWLFSIGLDVERFCKLMKDIMFNPLKNLSEAYN